jgi:hypothetical protein
VPAIRLIGLTAVDPHFIYMRAVMPGDDDRVDDVVANDRADDDDDDDVVEDVPAMMAVRFSRPAAPTMLRTAIWPTIRSAA